MQLQVQLSEEQIKVVIDAMQRWEAAPATDGLFGSLIGAMVRKDETPEEVKKRVELEIERAKLEVDKRRRMSMGIQIALMDVLANPKEHAVS